MQNNFFTSFLIYISLCIVISSTRETKVRYNGYRVYTLTVLHERHIEAIMLLKDQGIMYWGIPSLKVGGTSNVIVPPHLQGSLIQGLREVGIKVSLLHADLQKIIDEQAPKKLTAEGYLDWTTYSRLKDIYAFMERLSSSRGRTKNSRISGARAEMFSLGISYEGRNITGIKIFTPNKSKLGRPAIWIDSNIHSREWITSAVSTFLINELLSENSTTVSQWTKDFDWYIVPVVNPDGFEYSHTHDRLWRKSRSTTNSSLGCRGVDLNRNFGFHWNETGTSVNPCSGHFAGTSPFSEPETLAVSNTITELITRKVDLRMYISLHSFSQMILLPFGFNNIRIPQHKTYMRIAKAAAAAHAEKYGTVFRYGSTMDLLYPASGLSTDWVKGIHNVPLALTYELRDRGHYAALLSPEQIIPSALEFIDGLAVYVKELKRGIPLVDTLP